MANLRIKTGSGADAYLAGSGAGTDADPFVPTNAITAADPLEVAGPLTDDELRAAAVAVTGPLTDTQLRAQLLGVYGPLTDSQLRATAVEVAGPLTKAQLDQSVVTVTGNLDLAQEVVEMLSYVVYWPETFEGDVEVIAAPGASLQIVVDEIFFQNEMDVPCNIVLSSGGSTYRRVRLVHDGDWMQWVFPAGKELRLPANSNLVINKAGLTQLGMILRTRFESV